MIIKAISRSGGTGLAAYLMNEHKADRDKAELLELRGFATPDLRTALLSAELEAENTRCQKPLYHVSFRPDQGEHLTPEQWRECIDKLEHRLGLDDQARAIVMHEHKGEQHIHVVWSRIDREQHKARELIFDHDRCTETAREIEREYGLRELAPSHHRTQQPLTRADYEEASRQGRDVAEVRDAKDRISEAWARSDNGASLDNALRDAGLVLAKKDDNARAFVVVDEAGKVHGLGRTVGEKAKAVQAKLADLDRDLLPSVDQAKEYQKTRAQEREAQERAPAEAQEPRREQPEQEKKPEPAAAHALEQSAPVEQRRPEAEAKAHAQEITQARAEGMAWQKAADMRHATEGPEREAQKAKAAPDRGEKTPAPNLGRAAEKVADGLLNLADGLLGGLAGPVTYEQIRQQAAGTQQRTAEQARDAAEQFQKPLTPAEREAKAREYDRAAAEATRAREAYREAQTNSQGEARRAAMRAEYRANFEAKEAAKHAARLRETEQQRQEREAQERQEREAERRRRERQRER
mgnify:CR=1 FL=1